jgi:hypothetical protein
MGDGAAVGLKPDQQAAVTALASVTRDLVMHRSDDGTSLRKALGDADAPLQLLVRGADAAVDEEVAKIDFAQSSVDVIRQRLQETTGVDASRRAPPRPADAPTTPPAKADKAAAARDAAFELIRPTLEAVGAQLSALHDTIRRQAVANQSTIPGAFAALAVIQNDLESKRERLVRLRGGLDVFAKAHAVLHQADRVEAEEVLAKVLSILMDAPPAAPARP